MKLFKVISTPCRIWENGTPTNKSKIKTVYINPEYIISVKDYHFNFDGINDGHDGSEITVQGAMTASYYDHRIPQILVKEIEKCINSKK
jgi:hypothetical protein